MLEPGRSFGTYEIRELLGVGGMGEVYRASDSRLNRDVALKVLPDVFAEHPERVLRFAREAQVLASLNHPNIAAIHGLEDADGKRALVLELVEGPTLADRIAQGPLPTDEALPIAAQIADALEAAHEQAIIHRDLKPANIKLRADGMVKVLDFGLAKALELATTTTPLANSPTITSPLMMTGAGVLLGTAAYMSPEQARGKTVDRRTDIWSFGCVLFEMLTGRPAFHPGDTVSDAIAGILTRDPDWTALPADTPASIQRLLRRCLQKDIKRRLPHIGVVRLEIEERDTAPTAVETRVTARPQSPWLAWTTAGVAIVVAAVLAAALVNSRPVESPVTQFPLNAPPDMRFGSISPQRGVAAPAPHYAPSPDGSRIAYVMYALGNAPRLWLRRLDAVDAQPLGGTDDASFPFWSPDGQTVAFFASGRLKRIDIAGGAPQTICEAVAGEGGTWNSRGEIVFAPADTGGLFKVAATGGVPTPLTELDSSAGEVSHSWPEFLPDGRHYLYLARSRPRRPTQQTGPALAEFAVYIGSLDATERTLLIEGVPRVQYASDRLLFVRQSTLMAQPFDVATRRLHGEPEVIAGPVASNQTSGRTGFAVSDGVLLYRPADPSDAESILSWFGRDGRRLEAIGSPAAYRAIRLSPDDKTVAAIISTRNFTDPFPPGDLWKFDLTRGGIPSRLTFTPDDAEDGIVWSPDGGRIAFATSSDGGPPTKLMQMAIDKVAEPELLSQSPETKRPWSWSPDGQYIAFFQIGAKTFGDLWIQPLFGERKSWPLVQTEFGEGAGMFSPDGKWIAYQTPKTASDPPRGLSLPVRGTGDIYLRSFPSGTTDVRISQTGANTHNGTTPERSCSTSAWMVGN